MTIKFNNPDAGQASTMGNQLQQFFYQKKALIELKKEQYFSPLADVTSMPKNYGKKIKRFHYIPLLDDQNVNDQGLDAAGQVIQNGNLYGSSKDVGTISGKMPVLSENGGRVNRVGFKRKELEGTFENFGFFDEYTQDSMDFDSDADLWTHINREMLNGANEITEDALQIDLLNSAGVVRFAGHATTKAEIDKTCTVSYMDIMHLGIDLDNNRTPKNTTVITGSRMVDTRVVPACRIMYVGSELIPTLAAMKDLHGNQAWISAEKYAAAGTVVNGERGMIDTFRVVVVPEMMKWAGAGADASNDATCYETAGKYDVFPMLVVGDASFTTIGFQTDGASAKFKIIHKAPGDTTADKNDPYGKLGFMSIQWWYGFMVLRPERIGLILTAATVSAVAA